jgi:hypothetical protein
MPSNNLGMAHSFLIFNFAGDEDAAQQGRLRIEGWKQGFRLDKKLQLKFDRKETDSKSKSKDRKSGSKTDGKAEVVMIIRLDFSEHEKLSHQRWMERIPGEEPFKTAKPKVILPGDPQFTKTDELFDSLD